MSAFSEEKERQNAQRPSRPLVTKMLRSCRWCFSHSAFLLTISFVTDANNLFSSFTDSLAQCVYVIDVPVSNEIKQPTNSTSPKCEPSCDSSEMKRVIMHCV